MASAKQIAWRKKFAKMAKSGVFRKKKITTAEYDKSGRMVSFGSPRKRMANPHNESESIRDVSKMRYWSFRTQDQKTAEIEKDAREHMMWKDAKRKYGYGTIDLLQFYFAVPYRMGRKLGLPKTPPKYGQSPA